MEPSLNTIDDYNKALPKKKKRLLYTVISIALILSATFIYVIQENMTTSQESNVEQYVGKIPYK